MLKNSTQTCEPDFQHTNFFYCVKKIVYMRNNFYFECEIIEILYSISLLWIVNNKNIF